jgi:hypothetical protein
MATDAARPARLSQGIAVARDRDRSDIPTDGVVIADAFIADLLWRL